jgi:DNA invertase Pin-like site-specific DNA recombinase
VQSTFTPPDGNPQETHNPTKAAMYVRISNDHQKYSTENQADAIKEYAARRNLDIITTYADEGKSGLKMDGRDALKNLIEDVQAKQTEFSTILVLDVTRWGRFQDADESAHYEYISRRAGIGVEYVAEQFENDGSPVSTIVKGVRRAMAAEYSRELSGKVFAGQCRLVELGYLDSLLGNARVVRYMAQHHPAMLAEFQKVTEITSLGTGEAA